MAATTDKSLADAIKAKQAQREAAREKEREREALIRDRICPDCAGDLGPGGWKFFGAKSFFCDVFICKDCGKKHTEEGLGW